MKKRLVALAMCLTLVVCLGACGKTSSTSKDSSSEKTDSVDVTTVTPGESVSIDGKDLEIKIVDETEDGGGNYYLNYAKSGVSLGEAYVKKDSYVIDTDDGFIVLAQLGDYNDYCETVYVIYKDGNMTQFAGIEGSVDETSITSTSVKLETTANVLGSYGIKTSYKFTEEGLEAQKAKSYVAFTNADELSPLTLKTDLTLYTDDGETAMKAGDTVQPLGYDPDAGKFYVTYNGTKGYITYEQTDETTSVEGIDENEAFESLPYAG